MKFTDIMTTAEAALFLACFFSGTEIITFYPMEDKNLTITATAAEAEALLACLCKPGEAVVIGWNPKA